MDIQTKRRLKIRVVLLSDSILMRRISQNQIRILVIQKLAFLHYGIALNPLKNVLLSL
jgi:hypothetical protein